MKKIMFTGVFMFLIGTIYSQSNSSQVFKAPRVTNLSKKIIASNNQMTSALSPANNSLNQFASSIDAHSPNNGGGANTVPCSQIPSHLGDMSSGFATYYYTITNSNKDDLTIFGSGLSIQKNETILIRQTTAKDVLYCSNDSICYGAGLRLLIRVTKKSRHMDLSSFSHIAASVDLDFASATFQFESFGFGISVLNQIGFKENSGAYSVDNFAAINNQYDSLVNNLIKLNNAVDIHPVVVPYN